MQRSPLYGRLVISLILILQIIPLLLFPASVFSPDSQEWWLPAILTVMAIVAIANIYIRGGGQIWPWLLISFVQGFNIISRLMLIWPQGSTSANGTTTLDVAYILCTLVSMALSFFMLWYTEKPAVREGLLRA
jgi:hypothetical protein